MIRLFQPIFSFNIILGFKVVLETSLLLFPWEINLRHDLLKEIIGQQQLAYWANWPDFLKSDPAWKFSDSWHYINLPGNLDRAAFDKELADSTDKNLYKRAQILIEELKDKNLPLAKQSA